MQAQPAGFDDVLGVFRDGSPAAFTADSWPTGTHAAWWFRLPFAKRAVGPYFTRSDAEKAMEALAAAPAIGPS